MRQMVSNSKERVVSLREVKKAIKRLRGRMRWLWNRGSYMVGLRYGVCVDSDGVWSWIGNSQEEWSEIEAGNSVIILIKPYTGADIRWFLKQPLDKLVEVAKWKLKELNYKIVEEVVS